MLKFFRKIFFTVVVIGAIYAWINASYDSKNLIKETVVEYGGSSFEMMKELLKNKVKSVFNAGVQSNDFYERISDGYKLESLKKESDENSVEKIKRVFGGNEDEVVTLINKERFDVGLGVLSKNEKLMKSALVKAEDMKKDRYFEHISDRKIQPWFFVEEAEYQYEKFGENIALDYLSVNSVHKAFMDSIGHRKNILDENFKDVGVAIFSVETEEGLKYIIVEHFGKQLKSINPEKKEKYSDKSKKYCGIQKDKKEELKEMIKNQKKVIKEFEKEINRTAIEEESKRLEALYQIKKKINGYLDDCKILKKRYEETED
jgi:uncharacterized protein YkwD